MLIEYIEAAMRYAVHEPMGSGRHFAEIALPGFGGVWADGTTPEAALAELREVLDEWIVLGLRRNDPMPEVDGLSLDFKHIPPGRRHG